MDSCRTLLLKVRQSVWTILCEVFLPCSSEILAKGGENMFPYLNEKVVELPSYYLAVATGLSV